MKRVLSSLGYCLLWLLLTMPVYADKVLAEIEYFYSDDGTLIGKAFNGKRVHFEYDLRGQPGQGLPDPVPADYKGGIYLVPQYSNRGFMSVKPE